MATLYQRSGREDEAVQIWERLRAENPDDVRARLALAARYQAPGRHNEANALIQKALQVNAALSAEALRCHGAFAGPRCLEKELRNLQAAGLP